MRSIPVRLRPVSLVGTLALLALLVTIGVSPPQAQAAFAQRVRAGSTQSLVDSSGNVWAADRRYSAGGFGYTDGDPYTTTSTIAGTTDSALYQTNRHAGAFSYLFDVPNGAYQVRLRFAEIYPASFATGRRVFNVAIEGTPVLQNFDAYALVGGNAAINRVFTTNVADGVLAIDFVGVVTHGAVSAIEVVALGGSPAPTSTSTGTPISTSTSTPASLPTATATSLPTATATATSQPPTGGTQTITFDDLGNPEPRAQWPISNWPDRLGHERLVPVRSMGRVPHQSIGFNGGGPTSGSFTFLSPRRLIQVDAFNGGTAASSLSISCSGQPTRQATLAARQTTTLLTSWTGQCARVTFTSSNGGTRTSTRW